MRVQHLLVAAACAATALLAGCSQACHAIGGTSGFVLRNPDVLVDLGAVEVKVCVTETACATAAVPADAGVKENPAGGLLMVNSELLSRRVTVVTVSGTDTGGAEVFRKTVSVTPSVRYPNGKGCDPEVWRAAVIL